MANNQAGSLGAPALGDYSQLTIGVGVSVLGHMLGNLKIFFGPRDFDAYAAWLNSGAK